MTDAPQPVKGDEFENAMLKDEAKAEAERRRTRKRKKKDRKEGRHG